jgi:hypothetical protein
MTEILRQTELYEKGSWILDENSIIELDNTIGDKFKLLTTHQTNLIDEKVEEEYHEFCTNYPSIKPKNRRETNKKKDEIRARLQNRYWIKKELTIPFTGNITINTDSFDSAKNEPTISDQRPIGFYYTLSTNSISCRMRLNPGNDELHLDVSPSNSDIAYDIYQSIRNWMRKNRSPWWQRVWSRIQGWHWYLYIVIIVILFFGSLSSSTHISNTTAIEAKYYIENGINQTDIPAVLQLILKYQSNYDPNYVVPEFPSWVRGVIIIGLMISLILSIRPKNEIAIARGGDTVNFWKTYLKIIGVILPSLIFTTIIWPYLLSLWSLIIK